MSTIEKALDVCDEYYYGIVRFRNNSDVDKFRSRILFLAKKSSTEMKDQIAKLKHSMGCSEIVEYNIIELHKQEFKAFYADMFNKDVGFCSAIES